MNRKLLILDAALVGALVYAGVEFRQTWRAAKARETAQLRQKIPVAPAPRFPAEPAPPAVMATNYAQIPEKFLLDPSRNSVVVVEPPPPPPPPPPMPPLPVYHGQMNLGDGGGLFAILSVDNKAPHEAIHRGETIGQFKLVDVNREGIDFEWNGQTVHRSLNEVTDHNAPAQQAEADAAPRAVAVAAAPAPPRPQEADRPLGPGQEGLNGIRICQGHDSSPAGTVQDGFRKVLKQGPFGMSCYWEPVGGVGAGR